ncbi:hypothetical protein FA048_17715 [Pedobacter polaris]|uniref:Uncharacterized protein n=1 Tax=Pedobacter polaris TaxID=2571273 RepID=A0A4U1CGF7_9SPHI|nr:hypothetical protein [Pedobacter polaris]TKC05561.1 hypothetical protein FA048_17715 [Pedobacter polaris]
MEKKHLTLIIVVLIIAFGVYAYYYPPKKTDSNPNPPSSKPSTLRVSLIQEMTNNYRQTQLKAIDNVVENDANSILFDIPTLKKFINDIESNVKHNQPGVNNKLAIRMYYAAYPLNTKWSRPGYENLEKLLSNDITRLYERKHTLILLPVIKNARGIYADFNPLDINTYEGFIKKPAKQMSFLMVKDERDDIEVMSLNHGQIIPPVSREGQAF